MPEDSTTWRRGWRGQGDNTPVNHYEFYAVIAPIEEDIREIRERMESIEDRLVETRAKHLIVDLFITGTGRFFLIIVGLVMAYIINRVGYNPF